MQKHSLRGHLWWRHLATLMMLGLALGLPAFAADRPAAPDTGDPEPVVVQVGNATLRWHLDAAPQAAAKQPLIEQYQELVAARFTGDEVTASDPAAIETPAAGVRSSGPFSSHGMIRVPAERFHTLFLGADGASAVCAHGGSSVTSTADASDGEGR